MPATSQKQEKFFNFVHAAQKGEASAKGYPKVQEAAKEMKPSSVEHFMGRGHIDKDLPKVAPKHKEGSALDYVRAIKHRKTLDTYEGSVKDPSDKDALIRAYRYNASGTPGYKNRLKEHKLISETESNNAKKEAFEIGFANEAKEHNLTDEQIKVAIAIYHDEQKSFDKNIESYEKILKRMDKIKSIYKIAPAPKHDQSKIACDVCGCGEPHKYHEHDEYMKNKLMKEKKASFENGFVKAAIRSGLTELEAKELFKEATGLDHLIGPLAFAAEYGGAKAYGGMHPAKGSKPGPASQLAAGLSGLGGNLGASIHSATVDRRNDHGHDAGKPSAVNREILGSLLGQLGGGALGGGLGYAASSGEPMDRLIPSLGGILGGGLLGSGIGTAFGAKSYNKAMTGIKAKGFSDKHAGLADEIAKLNPQNTVLDQELKGLNTAGGAGLGAGVGAGLGGLGGGVAGYMAGKNEDPKLDHRYRDAILGMLLGGGGGLLAGGGLGGAIGHSLPVR